jgi:hypoxanthine phosphoribosyltransferase
MEPTNKRTLISESNLQKRIVTLAQEINEHYESVDNLIVISVLKGSVFFMTDLAKHLNMDTEIAFLFFSSYQGETTKQSEVKTFDLPLPDMKDRHILLIEDIFDTGKSLLKAIETCDKKKPASIKTCVLLAKNNREVQAEVFIDFVGFHIPNEFVVGYGLDYREKYRNLPYIAVLEP